MYFLVLRDNPTTQWRRYQNNRIFPKATQRSHWLPLWVSELLFNCTSTAKGHKCLDAVEPPYMSVFLYFDIWHIVLKWIKYDLIELSGILILYQYETIQLDSQYLITIECLVASTARLSTPEPLLLPDQVCETGCHKQSLLQEHFRILLKTHLFAESCI